MITKSILKAYQPKEYNTPYNFLLILNMVSPIVNATVQATVISFCSSIFTVFFTESTPPIVALLIYTIISTPPNYLWQQYLERVFPGYTTRKHELDDGDKEVKTDKKLSIRNTLTKFGLDQTLGAFVNVVLFLAGVRLLRGLPAWECWLAVKEVCLSFYSVSLV